GVAPRGGNQAAIDLKIIEREMLQVIERAEAGAEIVQREAAAPALQLRREDLRLLNVANRGCLGQLEYQARGADVLVRDRPIDDGNELGVADGLRRNVHVDGQGAAG